MVKPPNNLRRLRGERAPLSQTTLAGAARVTRDRYLRFERASLNRRGMPTLPTPAERERLVVALNKFGKERGLAPIKVEDLGIDVDSRSNRPGRPRADMAIAV